MIATLFFGGWDIPFMRADNVGAVSAPLVLLSFAIMFAKTVFYLFFYIWIRWTLPRFRYDQLMSLGWKVLLPIALVYIVIVAATVLGLDAAGVERGIEYGLVLFGVNAVLAIGLFFVLDRGRILSPAYGRIDPRELARLRSVTRALTHLTTQAGD